jgi:hypothetical protein
MISYATYKILHIFGIIMMFVALGGATVHAASGGTRTPLTRKLVGGLHGAGALISLIGGFGTLARLGIASGLPGWVIVKIALWALLAGLIAVPYRKPSTAVAFAVLLPFIGLIAVYLAIVKPF